MDKVTFSQLKKNHSTRKQQDGKTVKPQNAETLEHQDVRTSGRQTTETAEWQNVKTAEHQNGEEIGHQPKSRFLRRDGTLLRKTTVYLPPELLREARDISFDESISVSDIVQQGMRLFIDRYRTDKAIG